MDSKQRLSLSKYLSLILRHRPDLGYIALDEAGWVAVEELMAGCARGGRFFTRAELDEVVATNNKRRFAFSEDGLRIRAQQGHSMIVDLDHPVVLPPERLYHGTVQPSLDGILEKGLLPMGRHHVHLSADIETAGVVGGRRGKAVVLVVASEAMSRNGHKFRLTPNGVWLIEHVPANFISVLT